MLPQLIAALRVCPRYYASLGSHDPNASVVEYPQWVKFLDDFKLYKKGYGATQLAQAIRQLRPSCPLQLWPSPAPYIL